ncbi:MAG: helix-turn-helix domain-containing protein [Clostridia bacterium]|nr:helix-turn-helix domain-containing protein [Clostridia bacterium]
MYQIFVVEDELLIRQSIRNAIEHMQGPYAFCGEASDGEMALSMMQELMPDILLTDIRMPFLDGFGLIRHARAMMPWLKVVVISGYGDFEFTQKAISLGVDQYLLKPVRQADLVKVIGEIAARIDREKAAEKLRAEGPFGQEAVEQALRQHLMRQLLFGGADTNALLERAGTLRLDIVRAHYQTTVCYFDAENPDISLLRRAVNRTLEPETDILYDFTAPDQLTLLLYDNSAEQLNERAYRLVGILRHEVRDLCPVVTAVVGAAVERLGSIAGSYAAAVNLLRKISGISPGQVVSVCDTAQITADIVRFSGPFGEAFQQRLLSAAPQDVPALLDEALSGPDGEQFDSMLMRYQALVDLMKLAVQLVARHTPGGSEEDTAARLSAKFNIFSAAGSRETFRQTAEGLMQAALAARMDMPAEMKYSHVISRAEKYAAENFCDPNISMISVARHVGMSAAHFSTVFSQTVGRSFISYLTNLRMERAKALLRGTNMRLADIAMEIGYNEPNYFSHVFRKTEGMTPKEYRAREGVQ